MSDSPIDALINRVLELDHRADRGPWIHTSDVLLFNERSDHIYGRDGQGGLFDVMYFHHPEGNCDLIAQYRTAAPKLARALRIAVDALSESIQERQKARAIAGDHWESVIPKSEKILITALSEITKLVEEK